MKNMLQVDEVSVAYAKTEVVHNASFTLAEGEIGCLLGSSGCGKTTLLRAIAGFEPVTNGSIEIDGEILSSKKLLLPPEQRQIGMVFQDFTLFPHLDVASNIGFGLGKLTASEKQRRVEELLTLIRLPDYGQRYPHELSGGQQQRVALARAIAPKPRLLLLDEPFSSLDTDSRRQLASEVSKILRQEKITSLLVTHDQREAFTVADHIGVMDSGNILQWGTATSLYQSPANKSVASFVGEGQWLNGVINEHGSAETTLGLIPLANHNLSPGTKIDLLVRAHELVFDQNSDYSVTIDAHFFNGEFNRYQVSIDDRVFEVLSADQEPHKNGERKGVSYQSENPVYFTQ